MVDYSKCLKYTFNKYRRTYVVSGVNAKAIKDGKVVIPEKYKGKIVSDIERYAFENCKELKTVVLSDEIRTLQTCAFTGCENLSEVVFGKNLWEVRFAVFKNCTSLKELILPDSVEEFISPLDGCTALEKLVLSNDMKTYMQSEDCPLIKYNVLDGCKYLGNKDNPYFCLAEAKIDGNDVCINEETKVVASYAFGKGYGEDGDEIKPFTISIPSGLVGINSKSFLSNSIKAFIVDEDNREYKAEGDCLYTKNGDVLVCYPSAKMDEEFTVPEFVETIARNAIHGNPYIKKLDLSNVTSIDIGGANFCKNLKEIVFNEGLVSIGNYAFSNNVSLEVVELKEGLDKIDDFAFNGCVSLEKVVIPETTRFVGCGAFYDCSSLKSLEFKKKSGWRFLTKKEISYISKEDDNLAKKWQSKINSQMNYSKNLASLMTGQLKMQTLVNGDYKNDGAGKIVKY
jgi:hypothetical protein